MSLLNMERVFSVFLFIMDLSSFISFIVFFAIFPTSFTPCATLSIIEEVLSGVIFSELFEFGSLFLRSVTIFVIFEILNAI